MNIYFACSITGGRDFEPVYQEITRALLADGHTVPTAHLAGEGVLALEAVVSAREVFERDTTWIRACQALVAEVSTPSHGVGYEVAFALELGKPVLCLYKDGRPVSKMLTGNTRPGLHLRVYRTPREAVALLRDFLTNEGGTL